VDHFQSIQKIFSQSLLRIPDYQRGYAWKRSIGRPHAHIDDLLRLAWNAGLKAP
jgi:hypothetical protein